MQTWKGKVFKAKTKDTATGAILAAYLQDLSEEAHVLIQESEARAETMHAT